MTTPLPGLHLVMMEPQEVEALCSSGQTRDPGLVWVQLKTQRRQDLARPAAGRFGLLSTAAKDDVIVGVTHQLSESLPAAVREVLIEDMQDDVGEHGRNR